MTVAAAIDAVEQWPDLGATARRDLVSGLSTLAKWSGLPAADIVLTPVFVRENILRHPASRFGVTPSRLANVTSALRHVMRRLGLIEAQNGPVTTPWQALLANLDKRQAPMVRRLARFATTHGMAPDQVNVATLLDLCSHFTDRTLERNPRKMVGGIRSAWNRAHRSVPGWPAPFGAIPCDYRQATLPLSVFPVAFQEDLAAFGRHLAGNGFGLDHDGPADEAPLPNTKPLRPISVASRLGHVRWAATALVECGVPLADITGLRCLVTPFDRTRQMLHHLFVQGGRKPSSRGTQIADVLRIIARHYVPCSPAELARLAAWSKPVKLSYNEMTLKNEQTIRAALEPEREARLLLLPSILMRQAHRLQAKSPSAAASMAMRALAVEIVLHLPMRLRNLMELRIDQHLVRASGGRGRVTSIDIPAASTKTGQRSLRLPVADATAQMIDEWITAFRPAMGGPPSSWLFPGGAGNAARPAGHAADRVPRHITPQALRDAIKQATRSHVGVQISPHQFRHLAARMFLEAFPGHYAEVAQLLGHASVATTMRAYAGIEKESAIRRHDEILHDRMQKLLPAPRSGKSTKRRGAR